MDLAGDSSALVLFQCPWEGVHVHHDLGDVGGAFGACLDVDNEEMVAAGLDDKVRLSGEDGGGPWRRKAFWPST